MYEKIKMKKAYVKDFNKIYNIILECSAWLKSKGIKQWNPPYPKKLFKEEVFEGNVYLFSKGNKACGTVTLIKKPLFYYPKNLKSLKKKAKQNSNQQY